MTPFRPTVPPEVPPEQTYTPEEARALLQVGRKTIYALLRSGQLRSYQAGANYRVPASAIRAYRGDKPAEAPTVTTLVQDALAAADIEGIARCVVREETAALLRTLLAALEITPQDTPQSP
jgi:excisionase family DNA binding protein